MFTFFKPSTEKEKYSKQEKHTSNFIPYKCHWDKNTILTKDNGLLKVLKVEGFSFETTDHEDLEIRKQLLNSLFKNITSGNLTLYFHTMRKRNTTSLDQNNINHNKNNKQNFTSYLQDEWNIKNTNIDSYLNELYVSILYEEDKAGAAMVEYFYNKLRQKSDSSSWENDMKEMHENLSEITNRVMNALKEYTPRILTITNTENGAFCEISKFLATIINCGTSNPVATSRTNLDEYLPTQRLFFGSRAIEANSPKGKKYAGIISIREYSSSTSAGMLDVFLQMPFEFILSQSFTFANRTIAISKMQLQQNRMIQAEDKAVSQVAEISAALDMAMSGDICFGEHHISLLCIDNNLQDLENTLSMASVELSNTGIRSVRERKNMEASYWGQLPGNLSYIVRKATINSLNLAGFASMHNYPSGHKSNNHWGEHVTALDTTSSTVFYFNFHVRDVGHTLIIGPTGAGKTVLMNFLCAQAQKFKPRMFFFDKDHGAEIFIRAIGGVYTVIDPSTSCGFNPLQIEDNGENRAFLLEWLRILVTSHGESLNTSDIKLLTQAIDGNFKLDLQDRKLDNIVPFLGIASENSLASRISMWHGSGSHAHIFDNDQDAIDLNASRIFGFEMGELLKDSLALSPVLLYIFHRINASLDGSKTMIILDEAWALIDNPVFAPKIKDWLKVLRKLNTFVIFATQSVEDATKSIISDTLIQQTVTQIFLPNLKATDAYKTSFMLSHREHSLIKTIHPASRYFLIKQGVNSIVAKVNLNGMDDIINVLSGRAETVGLLNKIIAEYGNDPQKWLPVFYEEAKKIN